MCIRDSYETVTVTAKVARKDKDGKRVKEVVDGKKVTVYDEVQKEIKKDNASRLNARRKMLKVLYPVKVVPTEAAGKKKNTDVYKRQLLNDAQRRIPVQYAKKMQGRKMVGGQSTHIPLKINTAGVIPVIFASSILSMPNMIASFAGYKGGTGIGATLLGMCSQQNWCDPDNPIYSVGLIVYIAMIIDVYKRQEEETVKQSTTN